MWAYGWAIRNLIAELVMPPGLWIVVAILAMFFLKRKPKLQKIVIASSLVMIWLTSTNYFAVQLTRMIQPIMQWPNALNLSNLPALNKKDFQNTSHLKDQLQNSVQAIVVLGGGRRKGALESPQYQNQDLSTATLERVRYAAKLSKKTHLPILVTGGAPDRTSALDQAEASLMAKVLLEEYGIKAHWVEDHSNTTRDNAYLSAIQLKESNISHIYLVTQFWHIPRAQRAFEQEGIQVMPAPLGFYLKNHFDPLDFYPSSDGFSRTRSIWHEFIGRIYYLINF